MKYLIPIVIFIVIFRMYKKGKALRKGTSPYKNRTFDNKANDRQSNLSIDEIKNEEIDTLSEYRNSYEYKKPFFKKAGFIGTITYSPNYKYSLICCSGDYNYDNKTINKKGKIALFEKDKLLFKKTLIDPNFCSVNNQGTVLCPNNTGIKTYSGTIIVLDKVGKQIFSYNAKANLGFGFLSNDSQIAVFYTAGSNNDDSNKLFIVDLEKNTFIKFPKPIQFNKAQINTESKTVVLIDNNKCELEIDFSGKEINNNYKRQLLEKKASNDLLLYFRNKPNEIKYNDTYYLKTLQLAIVSTEKNHYNLISLDKLHRLAGEYFESKNDIKNTILHWEKAMAVNPKIGVKRKLEKLRKL